MINVILFVYMTNLAKSNHLKLEIHIFIYKCRLCMLLVVQTITTESEMFTNQIWTSV